MKHLTYILLLFPWFTFTQMNTQKLADSLKYVTDIPFLCQDTVPSTGCGDRILWEVIQQKQNIIPFLIDKLIDTTRTEVNIPNYGGQYTVADVAYIALQEIIQNIPTYELFGIKSEQPVSVFCSNWTKKQNIEFIVRFQSNVRNWYNKNKSNLVWVTSNDFLICKCNGPHPNNGHFELKK